VRDLRGRASAISGGEADLGMIPIENSIAGRVADIHHLLPHANLHIIGEHFLPIHFNLMAPKGATLETIKTVESHIHALGQCRRFIRSISYKAVIAADTAGGAADRETSDSRAARSRRSSRPRSTARRAAENVEDEDHNTTRFVILSRENRQARGNGWS
jgi:prephenate dehydratase